MTRDRADKWLWQARFFKTRSLTASVIKAGRLRINGVKVLKPATPVSVGDELSFMQADHQRVVHILSLATRRGPASEAQQLYRDESPVAADVAPAPGFSGKGRPSKKDRRTFDLSRGQWLE